MPNLLKHSLTHSPFIKTATTMTIIAARPITPSVAWNQSISPLRIAYRINSALFAMPIFSRRRAR